MQQGQDPARLERARALVALGRGGEALALLEPSDPAALRAESLLAAGRLEEARQAVKEADQAPAMILAAWLGWRAEGPAGCAGALPLAASAVERQDEDADLAAEAAALAIACQDEPRARAWFLQARAFERRDLISRRAGAEARRQGGDPEGAARLLARTTALYPEDGEARRDLGVAWLLAGQAERAVAELQAALQLAPFSQDLARAETILAAGALNAPQRAAQIEQAWRQLSAALDARPDPANAAAALERSLLAGAQASPASPRQAADWLALAERWSALRLHPKAVEAALTATRLAPAEVESWLGLARTQLRAGRSPDALGAARKAWELAPGSPEVAVILGRAAISSGDPVEGRRACESALRELAGRAHPLAAELQALLREAGG
jgi:tetratricopeptide (TPR) repeat protein